MKNLVEKLEMLLEYDGDYGDTYTKKDGLFVEMTNKEINKFLESLVLQLEDRKDIFDVDYDENVITIKLKDEDYMIELFGDQEGMLVGRDEIIEDCHTIQWEGLDEIIAALKPIEERIINLTPHDINIVDGETFESQGSARVKVESKCIDSKCGVNIYNTQYGEVEGLPEQKKGTYYIVSMLVKQALPKRNDLFSPSGLVRDEQGRIIGCKGLE